VALGEERVSVALSILRDAGTKQRNTGRYPCRVGHRLD
jgi:hypothetical protein